MRLLQVSNIVGHHQLPLARCLADLLGPDNFRFAATHPPSPNRLRMGWSDEDREPWLLRAGERPEDRTAFRRWWFDADAVLCGERLVRKFDARLRKGGLLFYMSERWWKPPLGMLRLAHPSFLSMALWFRRLATSSRFHFLPIGGYAATDMRRWAPFPDRVWQWAYFTDVPRQLPDSGRERDMFHVLWAGRMLDWKRVDTLIRAFAELRSQCPGARLTLVGDGPCRGQLDRLARRLDLLPPDVRFESSLPVSEVRRRMRSAHVYVLPSDGFEGWGAVINEAMTEGCAVVASRAVGAAATLIRNGENGLLFNPGDWRALAAHLGRLQRDGGWRERLAAAGQRTVACSWSPAVAARRFVRVAEALLTGEAPPHYGDGPMASLAPRPAGGGGGGWRMWRRIDR